MVRLPLTAEQLAAGKRLGASLRHARGERTLVDVAQSAGISPETLRKIETGRLVTPAFPTIAALARTLGVSLDDLADTLVPVDFERTG
ncbi:helix-turn-helix domain-containing protein [Umezawaea sp. NPDC059074]|uniref:helix-turn-helix domain-containing protein n=1 Tax=Umezawaea sp. NPDC059074 TaxID=3346716 RepID=UPI00367B644F